RGVETGYDIEHASGRTGTVGEFGQGEGRERRFFGGFEHDGAARRQRRRHFPGDHGIREIPGRNGRYHADRVFGYQQSQTRLVRRDDVAVGAFAFFGKPFDERSAVAHFAARFGQRFALFEGHEERQVVGIFEDQVVPATEHVGAGSG